jgi:hypothetical protein
MKKLLELFCGTKSIGKEFEKVGFHVTSVDLDPQFDASITADILDLDPEKLADGGWDAVWASPPCDAFTVMLIGRNWNHDHTPKHPDAVQGLAILEHTVQIIKAIEEYNPQVMWWIENPRGKMRRMEVLQDFTRHTVSYCQYGDNRMKPTDIWTNTLWVPRPMCKRGDDCHERAPRGSKTGTQGIRGSRDRAIIPSELCGELAAFAAAFKPEMVEIRTVRSVRPTQPSLFS